MKKWMLVTSILVLNLAWAAPVLADQSPFGSSGRAGETDVSASAHACELQTASKNLPDASDTKPARSHRASDEG